MHWAKATFAAILCLAFNAALIPRLEAAKTWRSVQTSNFHVVGAQSEKALREVTTELERFREVILLLLPSIPPSFNEPVRVVIFPDEGSFHPFKPDSDGKKRNVGGYFVSGAPPFLVVNGRQWKGDSETAFHEFLHFVVLNHLNRLPAWLNEGLAEFYRTFKISKNGRSAEVGGAIRRHLRELKSRGFMRLDDLFTVEYGSKSYRDVRFYAQSWLVVHYLMLGNRENRTREFAYFLKALNAGLSLETSLGKAFDVDFESLNKAVRIYADGVTFPSLKLNFASPVEFTGAAKEKTLSEAEKLRVFGELHMRLGHAEEAERDLLKSVELAPNAAKSLVALAALKARNGDEAKPLLERALQIDPDDYLAHSQLGALLVHRGELRSAVDSFEAAVRLKPSWAKAHTDLGLALLKLGERERADKAIEEAVRLAPYNPFIYYGRSFVHFQILDNERAAIDAAVFMRKWGRDDRVAPYMGFILHFAQRRLGNIEAAEETLADYIEGRDLESWPFPVFRYLQGEMGAEELIEKTPDDKRTEAHAYIGLDLLLKGKTETGIEHLTWVKENGNRRFAEYDIALAELQRLERGENGKKP